MSCDVDCDVTLVGDAAPTRLAHGQALALEAQMLPLQCLDFTCAEFGAGGPRIRVATCHGPVLYLGPEGSQANDINNRGEVVGTSDGQVVIWRLGHQVDESVHSSAAP
jgi:hypothetical protein